MYLDAAEITQTLLASLHPTRLAALAEHATRPALTTAERQALRDSGREPTLARLRHKVVQRQPAPPLPTAEELSIAREEGRAALHALVARAYPLAAASSGAPAKALADQWGVPVRTIHTWVREARLAGALPPARRGSAI